MSLSISLDPNNTGSPATYWVVNSVMIDFNAGTANVILSGYTSSTAFSNGDSPLVNTSMTVASAGSAQTAALLAGAKTNLYNDLLNYPMFSGASVVS